MVFNYSGKTKKPSCLRELSLVAISVELLPFRLYKILFDFSDFLAFCQLYKKE